MKKKIFILLLCVVLIATCILCGVTGIFGNDSQNSPKPQTPDTAVTENVTFPSKVDSLTLKVGESKLIELSSEKAKSVTKWTSSDSKIVTVDDADFISIALRAIHNPQPGRAVAPLSGSDAQRT